MFCPDSWAWETSCLFTRWGQGDGDISPKSWNLHCGGGCLLGGVWMWTQHSSLSQGLTVQVPLILSLKCPCLQLGRILWPPIPIPGWAFPTRALSRDHWRSLRSSQRGGLWRSRSSYYAMSNSVFSWFWIRIPHKIAFGGEKKIDYLKRKEKGKVWGGIPLSW